MITRTTSIISQFCTPHLPWGSIFLPAPCIRRIVLFGRPEKSKGGAVAFKRAGAEQRSELDGRAVFAVPQLSSSSVVARRACGARDD